MNPRFPIYIVSKGRWESRLTMKWMERSRVPYHVVVEEQEFDQYAAEIDKSKLLVLDKQYQHDYDVFSMLGGQTGTGSGPARNFAWAHALAQGYEWYWCVDDNIREFYRLYQNTGIPLGDGTGFRCMEDFVLRYENIGMAGPEYYMFTPRKTPCKPFRYNTRIYSCNLIRTSLPFRWRGRYNEDTDLSLRILKAGWCTILFLAFPQGKIATQRMKGGNTDTVYSIGTLAKSQMLVQMHPDVARLIFRYGRWHHEVNYDVFTQRLKLKPGVEIADGTNEYGLVIEPRVPLSSVASHGSAEGTT